jgi:hypothetical protein
MDRAGGFVVVWESSDQDGDEYGIFGRRFASSGMPLGGEFQVNTYTSGYQRLPSVAIDSASNFLVVWESYPGQDGDASGVFGRGFDSAGIPLGSEFQANAYTPGAQRLSGVALDDSGTAVVVWQSAGQDVSNYGIFGRRFDIGGTPLDAEFQINTYTSGAQNLPSVAAHPTGDFVVVWESFSQDGSNAGVFGQRFRAECPIATCTDGNACTADVCDAENPEADDRGCVHTTIDCDDGDPCTADTCDAGDGCANTPLTGFRSLTCALDAGLPPCPGDRIPAAITRQFKKARILTEKAQAVIDTPRAKKAKKRLKRVIKRLAKGATITARRGARQKMSTGCTQALAAFFGSAGRRAADLLARLD